MKWKEVPKLPHDGIKESSCKSPPLLKIEILQYGKIYQVFHGEVLQLVVYIELSGMKKQNRLRTIFPGLSSLGFGGWALGAEYWGFQDHKNSVRAIHKALSLGINHFDTAPVYGKGRSEQILGQQLRKQRSQVFLATKAFYSTPEKMKASLESSLKRLLTDYIDIFYIHWPLSNTDMRPGMEMLEEMRRKGKIRALGVSNFSVDQIKMVEEAGRVDVYQGGYNLFWPVLEKKVLPFLKEKGIGFVPYGVLAQGILTEKGWEHLENSHEGFRHKMILYREDLKENLKPWLLRLLNESRTAGILLEHSATHFAQQSGADSVLLGVRSRVQAERNFQPLLENFPRELDALMKEIHNEALGLVPDVPNLFNHKS